MKNKSQKHKEAFFRFIQANCTELKVKEVYKGIHGKPVKIDMNVCLFRPKSDSLLYGAVPGFAVEFGKKNRIKRIYVTHDAEKGERENGKSD